MKGTVGGAGGSITTQAGGGSIVTNGNGYIQFGSSANRITLQGTASAGGQTITMPIATGTMGVKVGVPASASAAGVVGMWASDGSYLYICNATNTWLKTALATW